MLHWLREHPRWLLVLDNLDQPALEAMRHWLPPGLPGHVIVTSRTPLGPARLGLEPLPLEVATSFLLERTGQDDATAARAIAEAVDGLPLALEQAAAYLIENDWRALAIRVRVLGVDHPSIAASWRRLAAVMAAGDQPGGGSLRAPG